MSLDFEKTSIYTAHSDGYTFSIHQSGRQFQVAIIENFHDVVLDNPPAFGALLSAKTYCESWLHHRIESAVFA